MTDWKDPNLWLKELSRSRQKRDHFKDLYEWEKLATIWDTGARSVALDYESPQQQGSRELSQSTFVNWIWAFGQTFLPAVYWKHPKINVWAKKPRWQANVPYVQDTINNYLELTKFRKHLLRAISDVLVYGHGWVKLGWFTKFGLVPIGRVDAKTRAAQKMSTTDTDINLKVDQPYTIRVSPEKIFVDPDATTYDSLRWIIEESYIPYESVKSDPYLKHTSEISPLIFKAEREDAFIPTTYSSDWETKEAKWCRRWEIWDRENAKVRILIHGSQKWNRVIDWSYPGIEGFPYKFLSVTDAINDFYPVSPVLPWLPLVEELSFIRSIRMEH
ncbi:MAG: hypothetical protein ACXABY_21280, partial [Candidatus Thorarchaeota archaeon]